MDELFMRRCFELARNGEGKVAPNPLVGAVVVHNGKIIGEGYHTQYGKPHAEVEAINSVCETELFKKSTLYVNLEPCSHYGKTPPCCELIVKMGIPRVVVAAKDPFPKVSGAGIEYLRQNNVEVTLGVLEDEARQLNKFFYTYHELKRPYISLKWAESKDGFIDRIRKPVELPSKVSNGLVNSLVHRWRMQFQSIMVGTNTVIMDNPNLTVRAWFGANPIRIIVDRSQRIPVNANVFSNEASTLLFVQKNNNLIQYPHSVEVIEIDFVEDVELSILTELYKRQIQSIFIEGGTTLLNNFLSHNLWDDVCICVGSGFIYHGIAAPAKPVHFLENTINIADNTLLYYQQKNSKFVV